MIKLQPDLTRLITTVFLLQVLSLQAQTASQPATVTPSPPAPLPTVSCNSLSGQTTGVQQRLRQYKNLVRRRECIVLNVDPSQDLGQLVSRIPDNTVILLSSQPAAGVTIPPFLDSVTNKTPVEYLIGSEIVLKNGQDIIGAADEDFEIIMTLQPGYEKQYMVRVGTTDNFRFGETRDSHIKHVIFRPTGSNSNKLVKTIIFAQCYNRRLIIENNTFYLPYWSAVDLRCDESLDASLDYSRQGPGLLFANNIVTGAPISSSGRTFIPTEGVFVFLRDLKNLSNRIALIGNTFDGKIGEAGEFSLGAGSSINIFRNRLNIDNTGMTLSDIFTGRIRRKGGFTLRGHNQFGAKFPVFNLAGNHIQVTTIALNVIYQLTLALACNHLEAVTPWDQPNQYYSQKAGDPLPLADECGSSVSTTVDVTAMPLTTCQRVVNTWTAIKGSTDTASSGLTNIRGQFLFDSALCPAATRPTSKTSSTGSTTRKVTTSSSATPVVTTALGVIITLNLLFNL